jgi:hypothetical protein
MAESIGASSVSLSTMEEDSCFLQDSDTILTSQELPKSSQQSDITSNPATGPGWILGPPRKRQGGKESWVWTYGVKIITGKDGKDCWRCNVCAQGYRASGTEKAAAHIKSKHRINESGPLPRYGGGSNQPRPSTTSGSLLRRQIDVTMFRSLLSKWIVWMHISFSQVESKHFRQMMVYVDAVLDSSNFWPQSGNTIRDWVLKDFGRCKEQVLKRLAESEGQIHLNFDLWTSPNSLALLGVVAHWMSKDKQLQTTLLGLRRGAHTVENMSTVVLDVIHTFQIENRIRYFMLDNAESNDTCIKHLC